MKLNNWFDWLTFIIVFIGGINWGLIGVAGLNLVSLVFGVGHVAQWAYIIVGLCAIYLLFRGIAVKAK